MPSPPGNIATRYILAPTAKIKNIIYILLEEITQNILTAPSSTRESHKGEDSYANGYSQIQALRCDLLVFQILSFEKLNAIYYHFLHTLNARLTIRIIFPRKISILDATIYFARPPLPQSVVDAIITEEHEDIAFHL